MKNIFKHIGTYLAVALLGLTSCVVDDLNTVVVKGGEDSGMEIKVFFPTKVVAGQPMTINGTGFSGVTEVVFPNSVSVRDFEIVSDEMIRVTAPSGIAPQGGKLILLSGAGQAESRLPLTLGNTSVTGFSKQPGENIQGGELLSIYGVDLEFIDTVELIDADGNPLILTAGELYRKGTNSAIIAIPQNIYTGTFVGKITTLDGKTFDLPELSYEPAPTGHWETVRTSIWKTDGSKGVVSWGGDYRFARESNKTGEEIYAIPDDVWEKMKNGTFYLLAQGSDWVQMRITTGWWTTTWTGNDICTGNEMIVDNGDGTYCIAITVGDDPITALLDEQHLLFTGGGYTPLELYFEEEVWVENGSDDNKEIVLWEGEAVADNWGNQPSLLSDAGVELQEAGAKVDQEVRFYITPFEGYENNWKLKIVEGHWGPTYLAFTAAGSDTNNGEFTEWDLEANGGYIPLTLTQEILDAAFTQQWWGGTFLANGDKVTVTKITLK